MLTVLIPAHNEGSSTAASHQGRHAAGTTTAVTTAPISATLHSLASQTSQPDRIIVIADNCTDDTVDLARAAGAVVFETVGNTEKKAGALNQWLDDNLRRLASDDHVMVMDADSVLAPDFLENALRYQAKGYDAVGGVFLGKAGGGFIGSLQRNEYARYARDVARKRGKTLVLTGTATVFTAECLRAVVAGREAGRLPGTGEVSHVYDTKALTEDNELTFALLHLDYRIIAPAECALTTEVMESWGDLWRQRYRWKRGAVENNAQYGFTRHTAKYWFLQTWGTVGILVSAVYLATMVYAIVTWDVHLRLIWMIVTLIFMVERVVTVRQRGAKHMALASVLLVEMPYDLWLQACQGWALLTSAMQTSKSW